MKRKRQASELPEGLEEQIALLVGRRGRDAFVREAVRQEIERRRVLESAPRSGVAGRASRSDSRSQA